MPRDKQTGSGKSAGRPSLSVSQRRPISFSSSSFSSNDISYELVTDTDQFRGEDWVTVPGPGWLFTCLNRFRHSIEEKHIGLNPVAAACISHGLREINDNEAIKDYFQLREFMATFRKRDVNASLYDMVDSFLAWNPLDLGTIRTTGMKSSNIALPSHINLQLSDTSNQLGSRKGAVAAFSMMIVLADENSTLLDHRQIIMEVVKQFFAQMELKAEFARKMISMFLGERELAKWEDQREKETRPRGRRKRT